MHRPVNIKGLRAIYERHTLNHHQFFTDDEMRFRDHKDWRVTVFPPYALVVFILMSIPSGGNPGPVLSPNVGWLFMCVTTGMYLIYEFMHFCCHVEENWFVRNCPFVNTLRRHHTAHHNARLMMEVNMNLTFPIADWLFGTSDLDRGLLGHLFNGYETRFLKKNLRGTPRRPDEAAAVPSAHTDEPDQWILPCRTTSKLVVSARHPDGRGGARLLERLAGASRACDLSSWSPPFSWWRRCGFSPKPG